MPDLNTGSIATFIATSISPLPSNISGLMTTIVDNSRFYVANWLGVSIGSVIEEKYQPVISDFATANTLKLMASQDNGVNQVSVAGFSTSQNLMELAGTFEARANMELASLSKFGLKVYKARG